jgi:hypothetical protein
MRNFATFELVDRETYEAMRDSALILFNPDALIALDDLRDFFGKNITVNNWSWGGKFQWRGFRTKACKEYRLNSQHTRGNAFDCDIQGYTAEQARQEILANKDHPLLKKITRMEAGVQWLHFDLGKVPPGQARIYLFRA